MWEAKVTTMVCLSTAEAEYYAAVHAVKSAMWLVSLVVEITSSSVPTVVIYEDNAVCIRMTTNPIVSARNRHFAMRMWWLREQVESGAVKFAQVPTVSQAADIFTKVLPAPAFPRLRDLIFAKASLHYHK